MEIFLTIISGTTIYVVGQIIQRLIIDPYLEYKKCVGTIDNKLKYYSALIRSSKTNDTRMIEVYKELRQLSCDLESTHKQLFYSSVSDKKKIASVAKCLIFLSNISGIKVHNFLRDQDKIDEQENIIRKNLRIPQYSE